MTFTDIARALRRSRALVAIATLLGALLGGGWTWVSTPQYDAITELFVAVEPSGTDVTQLAQGNNAAQQKVTSYLAVITSASVLEPVIEDLGLEQDVEELAEQITAFSPANSVLVDITVRDPEPKTAQHIADAVARSFIDVVTERLEKPVDGGTSLVRPEVIQPAETPSAAATPGLVVNVLLGLVAGLTTGTGGALVLQALDTRLRTISDLEQVSDAPLLGTISVEPSLERRPLVVHADPRNPVAEAFRALRTNVQFIDLQSPTRTLTITSALAGEGKSTIAANLAIAMSENGRRVALVDADLRRPRVAALMGLEGSAGLTDVLLGRTELEDVMLPWGLGGLRILPAGQVPPNPSELLGSFAMSKLVEQLAADFDTVIFDAPPLLPVTDAAVLSRITDGAVLVIAAARASRHQVASALQALSNARAATLGLVMSKASRKGSDSYGAYTTYHEDPSRSGRTP
ncbi:polysaccharide biosynthesis tyrosine autokinase [Curtobacterium sp. ME26]|uniref:polysaccharide biosynthesis tyrosine autokinase n=1 Tax=Curtobacterium sp. ME26 TaxID=2744254 RepID=UPI0015F551F2|nr:polysaccharide biosynthesis tyrosine autokinase [Curtobacterium sp. ME26]